MRELTILAMMVYTVMCLSIGVPKIINFSFGTNGKLMVLGVPIMKHFRVYSGKRIYALAAHSDQGLSACISSLLIVNNHTLICVHR